MIVTCLYKGQPLFLPQNTNTTLYNKERPKVLFQATWLSNSLQASTSTLIPKPPSSLKWLSKSCKDVPSSSQCTGASSRSVGVKDLFRFNTGTLSKTITERMLAASATLACRYNGTTQHTTRNTTPHTTYTRIYIYIYISPQHIPTHLLQLLV